MTKRIWLFFFMKLMIGYAHSLVSIGVTPSILSLVSFTTISFLLYSLNGTLNFDNYCFLLMTETDDPQSISISSNWPPTFTFIRQGLLILFMDDTNIHSKSPESLSSSSESLVYLFH